MKTGSQGINCTHVVMFRLIFLDYQDVVPETRQSSNVVTRNTNVKCSRILV